MIEANKSYFWKNMNRVLSSKQSCANPNKSIIEQEKSRKNTLFQENYCYCLIWMLIGILSAGIVLATIVTLYLSKICTLKCHAYTNSFL